MDLLLIKSRGLSRRALTARLAALRRPHPEAHVTLLADARPRDEDVDFLRLPDLWRDPKQQVLRTVFRLRRRRFDRAIILTDGPSEGPGTPELRFWALAARARERWLDDRERVRLVDRHTGARIVRSLLANLLMAALDARRRLGEVAARGRRRAMLRDLRRNAVPVSRCPACGGGLAPPGPRLSAEEFRRCGACEAVCRAWRPAGKARWAAEPGPQRPEERRIRLLQGFMYLEEYGRRFGGEPGRHLEWGSGGDFYAEAARRRGWETFRLAPLPAEPAPGPGPEARDSAAPGAPFQLITLVDALERLPDPPAVFARLHAWLAPGGACLLRAPDTLWAAHLPADPSPTQDPGCLWWPSDESIRHLAAAAGLTLLEIRPSLFEAGALEVWLRR